MAMVVSPRCRRCDMSEWTCSWMLRERKGLHCLDPDASFLKQAMQYRRRSPVGWAEVGVAATIA